MAWTVRRSLPKRTGSTGKHSRHHSQGPVEQHIQRHLTAFHGAFDPVPPPAQMDNVGQDGPSEAPLMVDKLTGKHSDQHDANKVRRACGQRVKQVVDRTRRQVYWRGGQRLG